MYVSRGLVTCFRRLAVLAHCSIRSFQWAVDHFKPSHETEFKILYLSAHYPDWLKFSPT